MLAIATDQTAFAAVVIVVAAVGILAALLIGIRHRDAFTDEGGRFWMFHGEADTSPHQMTGARFEERHVIDPPPTDSADGDAPA